MQVIWMLTWIRTEVATFQRILGGEFPGRVNLVIEAANQR